MYLQISHLLTYQYKLKESALVDFEKLLVPGLNVVCSLLFVLIIFRRGRIILVVCCPFYHLKVMEGYVCNKEYAYLIVLQS